MPSVDSLGEYGDPILLTGAVKIEEGANVAITRNDAHNSLILACTCPPVPPGCFATLSPPPDTPSAPLTINQPTFTLTVT